MELCLRDRPDLDLVQVLRGAFTMGRVRSLPNSAPNRRYTAGERLRGLRLALGLSLRDVHRVGISLAKRLRNPEFLLPPSRLYEFETRNVVPSIHRLYTLASAYRYELAEFLDWYGIPQEKTSTRTRRKSVG
jgi:transcriptional regulator with XRE-family HTH domain